MGAAAMDQMPVVRAWSYVCIILFNLGRSRIKLDFFLYEKIYNKS